MLWGADSFFVCVLANICCYNYKDGLNLRAYQIRAIEEFCMEGRKRSFWRLTLQAKYSNIANAKITHREVLECLKQYGLIV